MNNFMSSFKNTPMFLDRFFGQNNPKKQNYHFLTLRIYRNAVFLDTISRFYTHVKRDVNKLRAKFQLDITANDKVIASQ